MTWLRAMMGQMRIAGIGHVLSEVMMILKSGVQVWGNCGVVICLMHVKSPKASSPSCGHDCHEIATRFGAAQQGLIEASKLAF